VKAVAEEVVLRFEGATKRFGSFVAVDQVNFEIHNKEIVSIIGENGAGKSTFCKMLTGVYSIDDGDMYLEGRKVSFRSTTESMRAGIGMVYQERNLIGLLTGAQNICLGNEPKKMSLISEKEAYRRASRIRDELHLNTPLDIPVEKLGAGEQQLIEIMRAFYNRPKVLILDEPTASLGEGEIEPFLNFIKEVRKNMDIAIIFISHKIEEIFALSDRIVVLTDGKNTLTDAVENLTQDRVIKAMLRTGKSYGKVEVPQKDFDSLPVVLKVDNAEYDGKKHSLNFEVRRGEVVGFYGLVGSGRTECVETLYGLRKGTKSYHFNGETISKCSTEEMIEKGMIVTPEKRSNGIFKTLSLIDNISNLFLKKKLAGRLLGKVDRRASSEFSNQILKENDVKYYNPNQPIDSLSGGNIQKIIIGRSIAIDSIKLLILDEPTNGIDIGAKFEIYKRVRQLTDTEEEKRIGVLFISSELDELLNVCDRIYVFADGNIIQEFRRDSFDKSSILSVAVRGKRLDE
jgi:ABC-type sugar transport system ATPase subunit